MAIQIHPDVDNLIRPIIEKMTEIDIAQKSNPIINTRTEPEYIKEMKKKCVHVTYNGNEYEVRATKTADGRLVCEACGREIATNFDKKGIDTLMEATKIINQIVLFGLLNHLSAEPLATMISLKTVLPAAAQLYSELCEFVKRDEAKKDSVANLGDEYVSNYRNITSY